MALVWMLWAVVFAVAETLALRDPKDRDQPLTYYAVRITQSKLARVLGVAAWLWLGYHLWIDRTGALPL